MESALVVESAVEGGESTHLNPSPAAEDRRQHSREYMRRWRANRDHQHHEHGRRRRSYYERKARAALQDGAPNAECESSPICGFCRLKPSLGTVERILISEDEPTGFVPVLIPYCGEC